MGASAFLCWSKMKPSKNTLDDNGNKARAKSSCEWWPLSWKSAERPCTQIPSQIYI